MAQTDYDLIVVGAGAAGMTAACVGAAEGLRVLLLESTLHVGGTSAISGGMVWAPANHKIDGDSVDAARLYLEHAAPGASPVREAFLARAGEAVRYLEEHTAVRLKPVDPYPDYYPDLPGATAGGRVLEPETFDGASLGAAFAMLRPPLPEFTLFSGMMIDRREIPHLRRVFRSPKSAWRVSKLVARHARERLRARRGTTLHLGNALAARLLKSVLDLGVELRTNVSVDGLIKDGGRVCGVECRAADGASESIRSGRGIVLATGGFSHDADLRRQHLPPLAQRYSAAVSSGATCGARLGLQAGGRIGETSSNRAFWVPGSVFERRDGSQGVFPHTVTERAKPGLIAVDRTARRFVNEARCYQDFVLAMLARGEGAVPAYLICDSRFLWRYGLGRVKPLGLWRREDLASGYLQRGATIEELAARLELPAQALAATVADYNRDAASGSDPQFGRGGDIYQRFLGDSEFAPNPCVAPIEKPPFYAIAVYPADMGTAAGLVTDERARVLDARDEPIPGLYACGNDMHSVMNGAYPGPGITLGPALTFGYTAARDAAGNRN